MWTGIDCVSDSRNDRARCCCKVHTLLLQFRSNRVVVYLAGAVASGDTTFFPRFAIFAICTTSIWIFVDFETRTIASFDVYTQRVCAKPSIFNSTITNDPTTTTSKWWKRKMRLELPRVHWQSQIQNWWKSLLIEKFVINLSVGWGQRAIRACQDNVGTQTSTKMKDDLCEAPPSRRKQSANFDRWAIRSGAKFSLLFIFDNRLIFGLSLFI